jgi:flagellar basal-body rod modification protein FlgD
MTTNPLAAINSVQRTAQAAPSTGTAAKAAGASIADATSGADIQDRFLKLLVTQMRNQDPLNPLDNAQVTSQLAQLSTVGGLERINTTLTSVINSLAQQQGIAAAGLAGSRVAIEGDRLALSGGAASGGFGLEQAVDTATISITDAAGKTVRTIQRGTSAAGIVPFEWDGKDDAGTKLPDGDYKFSVSATAAGKPVPTTAFTIATVQGVLPATDGFVLNLGAAGMVPFASVIQILPKTT